ncbi:MAG: nucleoside phosphorylase [Bacillota bacterium]
MKKDEFLPILKTSSSNISSQVIVCGDPGRADKIAPYLTNAKTISYNREYKVINGIYNNVEVSVVSHGVGAAGAAVCFEELIKAGAEEIIRVGTAGSLNLNITDGDIVIAKAAVREDGLTDQLVKPAYPAVADSSLTDKMIAAGQELLHKDLPAGIVLTIGAFYPEIEPLPNNYYSEAGAIAVEMEASALFVIASLNNISAGAIFAIDGMAIDFSADDYDPHREQVAKAVEDEIKIALEALTS